MEYHELMEYYEYMEYHEYWEYHEYMECYDGWLVGFYDIPSFVGYLRTNPFFMQIVSFILNNSV